MPLEISDIEADLIVLAGPYLSRVGLDATTVDGTNEALRIPIRRAMGRLDLAAEDLDSVEGTDERETLLDLALYETLKVIRGNWAEFDQSADGTSQSLSQLTKALDDWLAALAKSLGPLALDPAAGTLPGPPAHGMIRAGSCYPLPGLWYAAGGFYGRGRLLP